MGEEVRRRTDFNGGGEVGTDDDDRVLEWEVGLPSADDLTPLSQALIPPDLASAFSISPEPHRSSLDVHRASQNTLSKLRSQSLPFLSREKFNFHLFVDDKFQDPMVMDGDDGDPDREGSDSRKFRKIDGEGEEGDYGAGNDAAAADSSARTVKRPRLVWTPQLHKRFVDVVAHIGIKNAVPKTIMTMMNVEGLTRENVASHLQKYRLYLKRMQGCSNEDPSSADNVFASAPLPQSFQESSASENGNGHLQMPLPMPYHPQHMVPVPYPPPPPPQMINLHPYQGYDAQQRDWSGNQFHSMPPYHQMYHRMTPNGK